MHTDPLSTALRELSETKQILEMLITSSETFDYLRAKTALKELNRKIRELSRVHAKFEAVQKAGPPNIYVLDFKPQTPAPLDG